MNVKQVFAIVFSLVAIVTNAQQFGAFPPSTKWQQIKTDTATIIFDKAVESQAQNIAAIIHRLNRQNPNSLGGKVRPINIILHKNTTLANGYVALGPFRSEYYLIPGSNIFEFGATPWQQTLAVHEYRHVHQYGNFHKGLSKVASVLFGQEGQALFNSIAIPSWFFEGDAVHAETIETFQGRGRAPHFFNGFKALWREGRHYSWSKMRSGSLKDFVPNHYPFGYMLVNYGYMAYGPDFWNKVTQDALTLRGFLGFFEGSIKRFSGKKFTEFRSDAVDFYKHEVSTRRDELKERETVTDYSFAQQVGRDSLLYLKSSYRKLPAFFIKDAKGEHRIKLRDISSEDWFSYRNGTIAYTSYNTSARWSLINYSNIVLLDVANGAEKRITKNGKYFTPDISPNGQTIAAVAYTDSLSSELHLLSRDGNVTRKIKPQQDDDLFVHPRFISDESLVVFVRHANSTMSLQRLIVDGKLLANDKWETLIKPQLAILGYPFIAGGKVYFVSSASGNDDIYSLELDSDFPVKKITQLTFGQTGNYFPNVVDDTLRWSHFTTNGLRLHKEALSAIKGVEITDELGSREAPFKIALEDAPNILASNMGKFSTSQYKKSTALLNFHSWRPNYADPEIAFSFYSDNILNTFTNEVFYQYNINENSNGIGFNTFYGGLFPVLNAGASYTFDRTIKTTLRTYTVGQFEAKTGYNIPLNFSGGKTYKFLNFGSNLVYNKLIPIGIYKDSLQGRTDVYLHHFISFSQQLPKAVQHIYPKFAYAINVQHRHLVTDHGFQLLGGVSLYLPSIRNHSIVLAANIQETDTSNITFSNRFANSRGYNDFYFTRMWRLSGNYNMPLFYPDTGIPSVLYFLRVRTNFFYDFTKVYLRDKQTAFNQRSVGAEMFFDTKIFTSVPATIGIRISHLLDNDFSGLRPKGSKVFEVVLPLNLIPQ